MTPEDTIIFGTPGSGGFDEVPGAQVGPYKLISPLGEGGFGSVWLAERRHPFVQRVALKLVKAGMDSKAVVARFDQERQALAVMNHPGIAKVFDGGLTAQGRPYFAMEYVKGEPITEFCDRVKLSIDERLKLFEQACEAVQHAHLKGIVHRDLKPGNVLAFMVEGEGAKLKVIDFGVAKAMSQRMTEHTIFTETGQMIGTPEYMSPEQADPTGGDIDTRSDIYSLGVLLYELLVGATPFDGKELRKKAYGEIQRTIREQDPPSPSARLSTISTKDREAVSRIESARKLRASDLVRRLRGELEWIPQKAMRKEPQHRYQTAIALAEDVRNYLQGKPIAAAPESSAYRMRKYVRRNRGLVVGVGAVMTALVVGLGVATWQWREAVDQRAVAEGARATADEARLAAKSELERANKFFTAIAVDSALKASQHGQYDQLRNDLAALDSLGQRKRFDVAFACAQSDQSLGEQLLGHEGYVCSVAFSPDGKTLASGSADNTIRLWDVATGRSLGEPLLGHSGPVSSVAFSPDGRTLASGGGAGRDGTIRLWDVATGRSLGEPLHSESVTCVGFSPDGRMLASSSWNGSIHLWDIATGRSISKDALVGSVGSATSVSFSPDGKTVASLHLTGAIDLWDAATGGRRAVIGDQRDEPAVWGNAGSVDFSPDGRVIASGGGDMAIRLWDAATGRMLGEPMRGHRGGVTSVAFSPDGNKLASASQDKSIRVWDVATGRLLGEPLRGHEGSVNSVAFSPDGKKIASGGYDNIIRLWDVATGRVLGEPLRLGDVRLGNLRFNVAFSPDGKSLAAPAPDGTIRLWDVLTGLPLGQPLRGHEGSVNGIAFSPNGKFLASGSEDATVRLWDAVTGRAMAQALRGNKGPVTCVDFSSDGRTIASSSEDKTIRLWDASTSRSLGDPLQGHEQNVTSIAFSPDGKTLASGSEDETIRLWCLAEGRALRILHAASWVSSVAFSPDGKTLASGCWDSNIYMWDVATGRSLGEPLRGHEQIVSSIAFSPDGKTLASGSWDSTTRLWDVATRRSLGEPLSGYDRIVGTVGISAERIVNTVAFSPDGSALASGSQDASIRIWDAISVRDRISQIRASLALVQEVRVMLTSQLPPLRTDRAAVTALQESVLADPRFTGDLRRAALIVVGEVDLARQGETERLVGEFEVAYGQKDWALVLQRLAQFAPEENAHLESYLVWNDVAWAGLTVLHTNAPERDLQLLLKYAERAVKISKRAHGPSLDTLARAHWELGDKVKAIEVQREAVTVSAATLERYPDDQGKAMHADIEATLKLYESLPAGAALPKEATPNKPAPKPGS